MSTVKGPGRLCNAILRNLAMSILAEKYDLHTEYERYHAINNELGIKLFIGNNKHTQTKVVHNSNFLEYYKNDKPIFHNLNLKDYFHTKDITTLSQMYLMSNRDNIINKNPFKNQYNNNCHLFLHIRLTDAKNFNVGLQYYLSCIDTIEHDKIYIGSDDFNHYIIKQIMIKYPNAILFKDTPIKTIQFSSTCKNIVLSHGSFSAVIGYLAFFSNVYYPDCNPGWCPLGMFLDKKWNPVDVVGRGYFKPHAVDIGCA